MNSGLDIKNNDNNNNNIAEADLGRGRKKEIAWVQMAQVYYTLDLCTILYTK